jgi:hypothetical protein
VVLYTFTEGNGRRVRDRSGRGAPVDLEIADPSAVAWRTGGGLAVRTPTLIASSGPATRLTEALVARQACTIEVWVTPANLTQTGPARIVTLSADTGRRNVTLGQKGAGFEVRFRTTRTSANGEPVVETGSGTRGGAAARHIAAARSADGRLAVVYVPVGGTIRFRADTLASGRTLEWYNPRSGERSPARPKDKQTFQTPDDEDWVLLAR